MLVMYMDIMSSHCFMGVIDESERISRLGTNDSEHCHQQIEKLLVWVGRVQLRMGQ